MPGPAPKDPSTRARRNQPTIQQTTLVFVKGEQPKLPARFVVNVTATGQKRRRRKAWPARTVAWWGMWAEAPIAEKFTAGDWEFLLSTAIVHAEFWEGDTKLGAELRQRESQFGITPASRAQLRISWTDADKADGTPGTPRANKQPSTAKDPRQHLHAV
jgi:hypothetical protein